MMTEPTEAVIMREIAAARRILREDRMLRKLDRHFPDEPDPDPDKPPAPPAKDPPEPPVKRGVWWGEPKV
jgi:hypothetical protein